MAEAWRTPPIMGFPSPPPAAPAQGGLLGKLGGLLGGGSYGGLLGEDEQKAAQRQALLAMSAQLMAAGGPSQMRTSFGQALGPALMAGQQAYGKAGEDMLQAMLLKTQLKKAEKQSKPSDVQSFEYAKANGYGGTFEDWKRVASAQAQEPAEIQAWKMFQSLPPDKQQQWIDFKRNSQPYQVVEYGGGKHLLNKSTGGTTGLTTAEQESAAAGQLAASTAGSKVASEAQTQAQIDMPLVVDKANEALGLIGQLRNHPGRRMATGGTRLLQAQRVPGTAAYDFDAMRSQVSGQQFLQAYETLKGGGQITEVEGQEAKNAIARMDAAQSEGAYLKALEDYERIIRKGVERAGIKASGRRSGSTGTWGSPSESNVVNWEDL